MYLQLHKLRIRLRSDDAPLNNAWQELFAGWLAPEGGGEDITLTLRLAPELPPLPDQAPIFVDSRPLPDSVGLLSAYRGEGEELLLHYLGAGVVGIPAGGQKTALARGVVTPLALRHGRIEDITFTTLAPLLRRRGYYLLHAFAAGRDGRCALIVGPSGSGKTTTGLSLILAGWELLANDVVLLEERPDGIYALPTPGGLTIRPPTFDLLPGLRALVEAARPGRSPYNLTSQQLTGGRQTEPMRVSAIFLPQIQERQQSRLEKLNRGICLAHLLEESADRWDEATLPEHINLLQTVCRQAEPYQLYLGQDVAHLPGLLGAR